jgi:hypothetical protein
MAKSAYTQLLTTTRRGGPGTINKARVELWRAIRAASACLDEAMVGADHERVLKACHAIAQLSGVSIAVSPQSMSLKSV